MAKCLLSKHFTVIAVHHARGRPSGDWSDPQWVQMHYEAQEAEIFREIVSYLKTYKNKGEGVSRSELARVLGHRPEKIEWVARKYSGTLIDGVLQYVKTPGGCYVVWGHFGKDPILCLHEALEEVYEIVVEEGQSLAICDKCGSRYVLPGGKVKIRWSLNDVEAPNTITEMWGEPFRVFGRVSDFVSGNGIPNAQVKVMLSRPPYIFWSCVGEGLTDDLGYFSVEITESLKGLSPREYALSIDAFFNGKRFVKVNDDWVYLSLTPRPAIPDQTRLSNSATVEVFVTSTEGAPLRNCHVVLGPISGLTDENGNAQFRCVPFGRYELRAEAPGYVSKSLRVDVSNPYTRFTITLEHFDPLRHAVVPVALILGPIVVGLAILGLSALLGNKGEG